MATSFPAMQQVSLFKLDLTSDKIKKFAKSKQDEIISSIVDLYDSQADESCRFNDPFPINMEKWKALNPKFSIRWYVSIRSVNMTGAAKSLISLSDKNDLKLGTVTEHHLIFLYKRYEVTKTATKTDCIFALTTDKANLVIREFVDFSFPLDIVRRICKPIFLSKNKMNLSGAALATNDMYKQQFSFRYSALESLSELIKGFKTELKKETSLYEIEAFKDFVKDKDGIPTPDPVRLTVGEMYIKFHHGFTIGQHAQICHQLMKVLRAKKGSQVDEIDPAFEYLDHIKKVPDADKELISQLNTLLITRVYEVCSEKKSHILEFYHHHYKEYFDSYRFRLREKKKKSPLFTWSAPPTAADVIQILKKQVKYNSPVSFYLRIKDFIFDFIKGGRTKTDSLATFFKGEVLHEGKSYFYLDGKWCRVEGEYYSFVQNEFLLEMRDVFLAKRPDTGDLPLAWVNNEKWYSFLIKTFSSAYKGKQPWEDQWKALCAASFYYVNEKGIVQDFPFDRFGLRDLLKEHHHPLLFKFLHENKGKQVSLDLLKQCGIKKVEGSSKIFEALQKPQSFVVSDKEQFVIRQNPDKLPQNLKEGLGDEVLKQLTIYWKRFENFREKEEGYNRNYLFSHYTPSGKPFGKENGFLVFDQVYANEDQKIELFDVARYTPQEMFLYHIKEGFGQKTRDACSQIRTAAAAIDSALKIGGNSDILQVIFDSIANSKSESPFREKVQEQILSFGTDKKEAKKHFLSLFKERQLTFVYAFLDSAVQERALAKELQKEYRFTADMFASEECTTYKGEQNLNPEHIFSNLKKEKYLDAEGRLTDKFIKINKADSFSPKFLNLRKKNILAIYRVLHSALSQFQSFIAKKELLDTKKYIQSLGYHFRICQIYRDGEPSSASFQIPTDLGVSSGSSPSFKMTDIFEFADMIYQKEKTVGDGACALHALMGREGPDGIVFQKDATDPQKAAKEDFLKQLDANPLVKLSIFFENLLKEAYQKKPPYEARVIFASFPIQEWEEEKNEWVDEMREQKTLRNNALWEHINTLSSNDQKLMDYCSILRSYDQKNWAGINQKKLLENIEERGVQDVLDGCWNALNATTDQGVKEKNGLDVLEGEIFALNSSIKKFTANKITENFDEIYKWYKTELVKPSFFMSNSELEIAAIVYNKKAILFGSNNEGECLTEHPTYLNCSEQEEADVVIWNEKFPAHYSRCKGFI